MACASTRQPTAVLVLAVWHEGAPPRLAARLTSTLDAAGGDRSTVTAAGRDEIEAVVRRWLEQVEARAEE